jgi:hypothetical protein
MADPLPIPGPPGIPFLGNVADIDPVNSMASFSRLADTYGTSRTKGLLEWFFTDYPRRDLQAPYRRWHEVGCEQSKPHE